MDSYPSLVQQLPDINLDPFRFCAYQWRRLEELIFSNIGATFGTSSPYHLRNPDICHTPLVVGYYRAPCILDHFSCGEKTQAWQTSGRSEPLGYNSARCDTLLSTHVFLSNLGRSVPHVGPGGWSTIHIRGLIVSCSSRAYFQASVSVLPGLYVYFSRSE